jgi:hypothetical protein
MTMSLARTSAAAALACLLMVGGAADAALHSADAAATQADADLALVQLPAGAQNVAGPPSSYLDQPAQTSGVSSIVDHNLWWTIPGSLAGFLSFLRAHPPEGFSLYLTASGGSGPVVTYGFGRGGLGSDETLLVSALQDGDHVDVRADAQVVWTTAKTAAEIITPSVTSATFDYKGPMAGSYLDDSTTPKPAHAHQVLTGKALRKVVADLDALQTMPAGGVYSCPSDDGELGKVRAVYGGQHVTFEVAFEGCAFVDVSADGHDQPTLNGSEKLITDLYATIGVRLTPIPVTPPQGPPTHTAQPHLSLQHNKVQAQRVADAALSHSPGVPVGAQYSNPLAHPTRPPYTGSGTAVDRAYFYTVKGTVAQLRNWYQAHPPGGYIAAQPGKTVHGVTRLVMESKAHPATVPSLLWISMLQKGDTVIFRVDGQTAWRASTPVRG